MPYASIGKKVCVLNFASKTNPKGGVTKGSSAQEESICCSTTLYPCLNTKKMWNLFYGPHRDLENPLYNNDCIYIPNVCVFKSDIDFLERIKKEYCGSTNIISCAPLIFVIIQRIK